MEKKFNIEGMTCSTCQAHVQKAVEKLDGLTFVNVNLLKNTMDVKYDDVLADMIKRDYDDSHRAIAPLKQADDAILADTSGNTLEESIALIIKIIKDNI